MPRGRQIKTGVGGHVMLTVPWRDDPIIRERLDIVARLWAEGKSITQSLPLINEWLTSKGYPNVKRDAIHDDRARLSALAREAHPHAQEEHSDKMRHLTERLYERIEEMHENGASVCRQCGQRCGHYANEQAEAGVWSVLQRTLAEYAKVDGAVVTRIETKVERTATDAVKVLVLNVLPKYVAEDVVLRILDDPEVRALEVDPDDGTEAR
jgi:hypothetical protein